MIVILGLWAVSLVCRRRPVDVGPRFVWMPVVGLLVVAVAGRPRLDRSGARGVQRGTTAGRRRDRVYVVNEIDGLERLAVPIMLMIGARSRGRPRPGHLPAVARAVMAVRGPDGRGRPELERDRCRRWLALAARLRPDGAPEHPRRGHRLRDAAPCRGFGGASGRPARLVRLAVLGLGAVLLFLTFSRAAWIGFARRAARRLRHARGPRRPGGHPAVGERGRRHGARRGSCWRCRSRRNSARGPRSRARSRPRSRSIDERLALMRCRRWRSSRTTPVLGTGLGLLPLRDRRTRAGLRLRLPARALRPARRRGRDRVDRAAVLPRPGCRPVAGARPDPIAVDAVARLGLCGTGGGHGRRAVRFLHVGTDGGPDVGVDRAGAVGRRVSRRRSRAATAPAPAPRDAAPP